MEELVEAYVMERSTSGQLNSHTSTVTTLTLRSFARHLEGDMSRIGERAVRTWLERADSDHTKRTMMSRLRPFVRWLVNNGHAPTTVLRPVITVRVGTAARPPLGAPEMPHIMGTLAPFIREYLAYQRKRGQFTRGTVQRVGYTLAGLNDSFGNRPMEQYGTRAIERWIGQHEEWKPASRRTFMSTVKVFTKWLAKNRYIKGDPFADIDFVKIPRPVPRPIDRPSIDALLAAAPDARGRLIVMLQFSMGLRCIGVSNLRIEDIDYVSKVLIVKEKFGNERRLPVTPAVVAAIETYLCEHPARTGPLLRSYKEDWEGLSAAYIGTLVARWMRAAGVKHYAYDGRSAHSLRHTALTELAEATGDAFLVQELAGWSSPATAAHYVRRASTERLREAMAKRDEVTS